MHEFRRGNPCGCPIPIIIACAAPPPSPYGRALRPRRGGHWPPVRFLHPRSEAEWGAFFPRPLFMSALCTPVGAATGRPPFASARHPRLISPPHPFCPYGWLIFSESVPQWAGLSKMYWAISKYDFSSRMMCS